MTDHHFLGTKLPIIQAPMAGVQDSQLAIAVSNAGGLGSLPCAMLNHEVMCSELDKIKEQTKQPINVNFFCHQTPKPDPQRERQWRSLLQPYFTELGIESNDIPNGPRREPFSKDLADIIEDYRPAIISFHFGLPAPDLVTRVKSWGTKILASATTIEEAIWLEAHGADAIIAQGLEAGGHRGMFLSQDLTTQVGTFALLPQIVKAVNLPVIAAGGIVDAEGVSAALALGASAVQIGTAYLLCPETKTSQLHRTAIQNDQSHLTAITNLFSGRPARSIINRVMREIGPINKTPEFPLASTAITRLRTAAEKKGSSDFSSLWCGQNTTGCKAMPAAELTRELAGKL